MCGCRDLHDVHFVFHGVRPLAIEQFVHLLVILNLLSGYENGVALSRIEAAAVVLRATFCTSRKMLAASLSYN